MEDLTEGASTTSSVPEWACIYEWGCAWVCVEGADGTSIGTGYQNTMDIVNQGCTTNEEGEGIVAAEAALDYESGGYTDWYLPSKDELIEMYYTIGNGGPEGNIGGFETSECTGYWSSSKDGIYDDDCLEAWTVWFSEDAWNPEENGGFGTNQRLSTKRVRPIRSF